MEITPLDIRNQAFKKKKIGGYDPEEVDSFLTQIASDLEIRNKEYNQFKEKLKLADDRVRQFQQIEATLQDSVVTMQKNIDETRRNAHKEAELIIGEAKARAEKDTATIRKEADDLREEISILKTQRKHLFIRMHNVINSQRELLEALEREDNFVEEIDPGVITSENFR
ncbi:MAG: DivIVA domain-containing protein [Fibrobacterales bacterium]